MKKCVTRIARNESLFLKPQFETLVKAWYSQNDI